MPDPDPDSASASDIRYDNWPIEERAEYADWDIERATPQQHDSMTEDLAEEYDAELGDDIEWVGGVGGQGGGHFLYSPQEGALYNGELDEEDERVILREASHRDIDEESLGEHIEAIGEAHDWEWLSSFARAYLEDDADDQSSGGHRDSEFQQRNVAATDPYDLAFYGSHTFADDSGQIHTIDRFFDVYLDDAGAVSRVEVESEYLIAEPPAKERRDGDADLVAEDTRTIDVTADTEQLGGEGKLAARLEEWHESHAGWPRDA